MRAVCVSNDPRRLTDHQRSRATEFESEYPLTVGETYVALGMSIWETVFEFLVRDDWGGLCLAPAGFFELLTEPIPEGWLFGLRSGVRAFRCPRLHPALAPLRRGQGGPADWSSSPDRRSI